MIARRACAQHKLEKVNNVFMKNRENIQYSRHISAFSHRTLRTHHMSSFTFVTRRSSAIACDAAVKTERI